MLSIWNLRNATVNLWPKWLRVSHPKKPCPVCNSVHRAPSQKVIDAHERVLFSVPTGVLRQSAAQCPVCDVFYMAVTKYPWPSERPSDRILRPQSNDLNRVVVSTDGFTLKIVVASNLNEDIISPALYMYITGSRDRLPCTYFAPFRDISIDPSSKGSFGLVNEWIRDCDNVHEACHHPILPPLPKRLIELVTDSHQPQLRLIDSTGLTGRYCALSHCWGRLECLTLTKTSSGPLQQSILWERMPKTFQDAVVVTRNVGVHYLWIDSLCIYQDDMNDWASEAANMAAVYRNAFLVIAASSSANGGLGCFANRNPMPCIKVGSIPLMSGGGVIRPKIFVRERFEHVDFDPNLPQTNTKLEPLLGRAWAFQERWLATRILHYASNEMVWKCRSSMHCECGGYELEKDNRVIRDQSHRIYFDFDPMKLVAEWFWIVENYTARKLRRQSDKLVALAGIARQLRRPDLGRYLAGIWEVAFVRSLLWSKVGHQLIGIRHPSVAPSWSWASISDPVHYSRVRNLHDPVDAEVVEVSCKLKSVDEHGQVSGGYAVLKARVANLELLSNGAEEDDEDGQLGRITSALVSYVDGFPLPNLWLDVDLYQGSDYCSHGQALVGACIMIDPLDAGKCFALILRPLKPHERPSRTEDRGSTFVRIGMTTGARVSMFENEKQTVTII